MRILRDQRLVDCRGGGQRASIYLQGEPSPSERETAVWRHVSKAFREPVLREDDHAGYAPTQIIAESFRDHGYDGIAYGSGFGEGTTNIVLFDTSAAEIEACEIHEIRNVRLEHVEIDNPYYVRKDEEGRTALLTSEIVDVRPVDDDIRNPSRGEAESPVHARGCGIRSGSER